MKVDVVLAERALLVVGFLAIVVALTAIDWRLGLFVAGAILLASTVDWRPPR